LSGTGVVNADTNEDIGVNSGGSGTFTQTGGQHNVGPGGHTVFIGRNAGSSGSYSISGSSSTLSVHGNMQIGYGGRGPFPPTVGLNPADNVLNKGAINNNGGTLHMGGRIYGSGTVNSASGTVSLADGTSIDQTQFNILGGSVSSNGAGGGAMPANTALGAPAP